MEEKNTQNVSHQIPNPLPPLKKESEDSPRKTQSLSDSFTLNPSPRINNESLPISLRVAKLTFRLERFLKAAEDHRMEALHRREELKTSEERANKHLHRINKAINEGRLIINASNYLQTHAIDIFRLCEHESSRVLTRTLKLLVAHRRTLEVVPTAMARAFLRVLASTVSNQVDNSKDFKPIQADMVRFQSQFYDKVHLPEQIRMSALNRLRVKTWRVLVKVVKELSVISDRLSELQTIRDHIKDALTEIEKTNFLRCEGLPPTPTTPPPPPGPNHPPLPG
ncbi:hypothetical protein AAMO2058_001512900 [Amorphochlora amoebiformis]